MRDIVCSRRNIMVSQFSPDIMAIDDDFSVGLSERGVACGMYTLHSKTIT